MKHFNDFFTSIRLRFTKLFNKKFVFDQSFMRKEPIKDLDKAQLKTKIVKNLEISG